MADNEVLQSKTDKSGEYQEAMSERVEIIPSAEQEFEDYRTSGERIRLSFGLENGGKFAYYDGGSALMTYREEALDGGRAMHAAAMESTSDLHEVLKDLDIDSIVLLDGDRSAQINEV